MRKRITIFLTIMLVLSSFIVGCTSTSSGQATTGIIGQSTIPPQISDSSSCFKFSNLTTSEFKGVPGQSLYVVKGLVTNICMKNFDGVCVRATFYDVDNMVVESKNNFIQPLQHGTTVSIGFNSLYEQGAGKNKATRYQLEAYQLEPKRWMEC
jgi:hypothetical protein